MKKKHILGLDLGTNSIGWALLTAENSEDNNDWQLKSITDAGSRIIPMDAALRGDFEKGNTVSARPIVSAAASRNDGCFVANACYAY